MAKKFTNNARRKEHQRRPQASRPPSCHEGILAELAWPVVLGAIVGTILFLVAKWPG